MSAFSERRSGVLLHVTSLPGRHGSGDLGREALAMIDWLASAGQTYWQMLPVVPPAGGNSPYQSTSAFAGDPDLVSLEGLAAWGLLDAADTAVAAPFPDDAVDFPTVHTYRAARLRKAFEAFRTRDDLHPAFAAFCEKEAAWLEDYALFAALKEENDGRPWTSWERGLVTRKRDAMAAATTRLRGEIRFHQFAQHVFHQQWAALRTHAKERGVQLVGDIPIFVGHDSADVWAHPELFLLDADGGPTVVAGVPPDYFSKTGQRWGNVLYRWDAHRSSDFRWWVERFQSMLNKFDGVRVDHFIGFHRYWAIPHDAETAVSGSYQHGPGAELFSAVGRALGDLPVIAEDLGLVTPEVTALRQRFGFPGMRVLQFSFSSDPTARHILPHTTERACVVYTGTHDNDTTVGWFAELTEAARVDPKAKKERDFVLRYVGGDGTNIARDLIRLALSSAANTAILPAQDLLSLGTKARMNVPGRADGNWAYRLAPGAFTSELAADLRELTETFARTPI